MKIWREIRLPVSILLSMVGIFFTVSSIKWVFMKESQIGGIDELSGFFGDWNYYLIVIGPIILILGIWYTYDYIKKKNFLLEEIKTDRKSELVKRKSELEKIVKTLPRKYEDMLREKERNLGLR